MAEVTASLMLDLATQELASDLYEPESMEVMRVLAQDWASARESPPTFFSGMYVSQSECKLSLAKPFFLCQSLRSHQRCQGW